MQNVAQNGSNGQVANGTALKTAYAPCNGLKPEAPTPAVPAAPKTY